MKDKCIMCNTTNTDGCYSIQGQTVCKDCGKRVIKTLKGKDAVQFATIMNTRKQKR